MDTPIYLAQALKEAGLAWEPTLHDFFAVPDAGLDDQLFVLTDMMVDVDVFHGRPAFTFVGSVEWALDYVLQAEAVWIPTETQLRRLLQEQIDASAGDSVCLQVQGDMLICRLTRGAFTESFVAESGAEAYARALLSCIGSQS